MADLVDHDGFGQVTPERPPHMRWQYLAIVFVGGVVGTGLRELVGQLIPRNTEFPLATFSVNVLGAYVLGVLLVGLGNSRAQKGRRRALRLFGATGVLGGFTTYSGLASDSALLTIDGHGDIALLYALGTVLIGAAASGFGIWCGYRLRAAKQQRMEQR